MKGKEVKSPLKVTWKRKEGREKMGLDDLLWFGEKKKEILNLTDNWGYHSAFPSDWSPLKEKRSFLCNAQKFTQQ